MSKTRLDKASGIRDNEASEGPRRKVWYTASIPSINIQVHLDIPGKQTNEDEPFVYCTMAPLRFTPLDTGPFAGAPFLRLSI